MEKINVTTEEEFQGDAYRTVEKFSFEIFDIYKNNQLFRNANRGKVWTFWNALVFCGTIYTTMGEFSVYYIITETLATFTTLLLKWTTKKHKSINYKAISYEIAKA